ncbi:hypothetical protein BJ085DRAFT_18210 [Dimargaris cristalligena]|uniref:Amine oxidase domain-containing protein n=1 Tax=Dimargaris cristalligena TaxID=215637 RepID=A0A4P9ZZ94_9FUNG|nr:hypothetical protein BJ085DRAFT_18210 [Dimargaris cristalligena]|eukprot:RKP39075.1 hypothetical protein BJ085DRAFT_18210 [Dimargaris cristalligena]
MDTSDAATSHDGTTWSLTGKRIAVIGSGVSGLGAAWLLANHSPHRVTLYEKGDYIGGHTHTVPFQRPPSLSAPANAPVGTIPVDTGFITYNKVNYPNLVQLFEYLGVATEDSCMSFGVSRDQGQFEWSSDGLSSIFVQLSNLWNPGHWRMIYDMVRFTFLGTELLHLPADHPDRTQLSIGSYLDRNGYSPEFRNNYLIPMTAAIWTTPMDRCSLEFPASTLIQFLYNHCLLRITGFLQWRTVTGGSQSYVKRIVETLPDVRVNCPVTGVRRFTNDSGASTVAVTDGHGNTESYDYVVFATHADQALAILGTEATGEERELLAPFRFTANRAVLHTDLRLMPIRRGAWSSWNYLVRSPELSADSKTESPYHDQSLLPQVSLTYCMNKTQNIPEDRYGPVLVTLNPLWEPDPALTLGSWNYEHPEFTPEMVAAQRRLPSHIFFCGAWTHYGFHEDGLTSGLEMAKALGAVCPFDITDASQKCQAPPPTTAMARSVFAMTDWIIQHCSLMGVFLTLFSCIALWANLGTIPTY